MNTRAVLFALVLCAMSSHVGLAAGPDVVYTVVPCRAVDTRFAGGEIAANTSRAFKVRGELSNQGGVGTCNIPPNADGIFGTVVAVSPSAAGFLTAAPYGLASPLVSTLNFYAGQTTSNGMMVPLCAGSCFQDLSITVSQARANVVVDITGYLLPAGTSGPVTGGGGGGPVSCTPTTCAAGGVTCGTATDGCGGTLTCGNPCAPQDPNAFSWFKIVAPTWSASQGPMPILIGAMIDDRAPQQNYTGTCTIGLMSPLHGQVLQVYDEGKQLLPGLQTTPFVNGGWRGHVVLKTGTGQSQVIGLSCFDSKIGVGGNSNAFEWIVP